ncbi:hypothetical protein Q9233_017498 [Columba guinea]|nr:hypothetical protein Q9233_017498 [Columba guinea]
MGRAAMAARAAVCLAGLALSLYALHVEREHARDPGYRAACDLAPAVSCTRGQRAGRAVTLALLGSSAAALAASLWLAGVLALALRDLCLVCVATYVLNVLLLVLNLKRLRKHKTA